MFVLPKYTYTHTYIQNTLDFGYWLPAISLFFIFCSFNSLSPAQVGQLDLDKQVSFLYRKNGQLDQRLGHGCGHPTKSIQFKPSQVESPIYIYVSIRSVSKPVVSICASNQAHCLNLGMHGAEPAPFPLVPPTWKGEGWGGIGVLLGSVERRKNFGMIWSQLVLFAFASLSTTTIAPRILITESNAKSWNWLNKKKATS